MEKDDQPQVTKMQELNTVVKEAISSDQIAHIYANGFINVLTNADVVVILQRNHIPVALANMSYTTAKSFYQKLGDLILNFEAKAEHTIMTTDIVDKALISPSGEKDEH